MAPVHRRNRPLSLQTENSIDVRDTESTTKKPFLSSYWKALIAASVVVVIFRIYSIARHDQMNVDSYEGIHNEIAPGVSLIMDLLSRDDSSSTNNVVATTTGPHTATVSFQPTSKCNSPRVWVRLMGDALIFVPIKSIDGSSKWAGTFSFPFEGAFQVEVEWICDQSVSVSTVATPMDLSLAGNTTNMSSLQKSLSSEPIFPQGLWLSSTKFKTEEASPTTQQYIWHDPSIDPNDATLLMASSSLGKSLISKESTPIPDKFRELSNYELVCFVGGQSAASIREAFLSVRPELFPNQRPFKFHYYNITSFQNPDQHWEEETKKRFRKCKTIVVSVDELDNAPLTNAEYKQQVKTFLNHVVKAIPDDTFPIWMVTVNESPIKVNLMCSSHSKSTTHQHPCNDALFELWNESTFPPRVKLLDTTNLVNPQLGENQQDIVAVIAMRIYVLVGHQVAAWRRAQQIGKVDGLHRNGKVEPNPKEVPYDWTS